MLRIENRLERIERELGMDAGDDEPFELDFGSGGRFTTTNRELDEILADIQRSGSSRILPGRSAL